MRQINTRIPDTTFSPMKSKKRVDAYNALHDKNLRFNIDAYKELLDIWMEVEYELDTYTNGLVYVANLGETLKNHKYYEKYLQPSMEMFRSEAPSDTFSKRCNFSQKTYAGFSSCAPLPLKAALLSQGIEYQTWNRPDTYRGVIRNFMWNTMSEWFYNQVDHTGRTTKAETRWRKYADLYQNESTYSRVACGTAWNIKRMEEYIDDEDGTDNSEYFNLELNKVFKHMMMQTWIFDPSVRHRDMILHPFNWSYKPEPFPWLLKEKVDEKEGDNF